MRGAALGRLCTSNPHTFLDLLSDAKLPNAEQVRQALRMCGPLSTDWDTSSVCGDRTQTIYIVAKAN